MEKVFKIKELAHLKLLSDPLKLQLVKSFAEKAKTTKQVADELGQNITKLYRHVDALHAAGLITIEEQTKKRGTVERTFRAVAERFETDPSLFNNSEGAVAESGKVIREMFRATEEEILSAPPKDAKEAEEALFARLRCKLSKQRAAELRQKLMEWVEEFSAEEDEAEGGEETEERAALIAFYPIRSKEE